MIAKNFEFRSFRPPVAKDGVEVELVERWSTVLVYVDRLVRLSVFGHKNILIILVAVDICLSNLNLKAIYQYQYAIPVFTYN